MGVRSHPCRKREEKKRARQRGNERVLKRVPQKMREKDMRERKRKRLKRDSYFSLPFCLLSLNLSLSNYYYCLYLNVSEIQIVKGEIKRAVWEPKVMTLVDEPI